MRNPTSTRSHLSGSDKKRARVEYSLISESLFSALIQRCLVLANGDPDGVFGTAFGGTSPHMLHLDPETDLAHALTEGFIGEC